MTEPPVLEVDLGPGVRAGFTTAEDGFNLGLNVGDREERVLARRAVLDRWVGAPVVFARQVHAADVVVVSAAAPSGELFVATADALVAVSSAVAPAVLVADCVPLLLADAQAGVVAAVHAGRRGLVAGVVEAALARMEGLGARPGRTRAVIGPAACGACYEVPADLRDEVAAVLPGTASTTSWGTPALDLPAGVRDRLTEAGVTGVIEVGGCTIEDHRWFSHRGTASGRPAGRGAAVVRLLPE